MSSNDLRIIQFSKTIWASSPSNLFKAHQGLGCAFLSSQIASLAKHKPRTWILMGNLTSHFKQQILSRAIDEDRSNINFSLPDQLNVLSDLHTLTEKSKQECLNKRWRYTRNSFSELSTGARVTFRPYWPLRWVLEHYKEQGEIPYGRPTMHGS
jgi:hypothetical protein